MLVFLIPYIVGAVLGGGGVFYMKDKVPLQNPQVKNDQSLQQLIQEEELIVKEIHEMIDKSEYSMQVKQMYNDTLVVIEIKSNSGEIPFKVTFFDKTDCELFHFYKSNCVQISSKDHRFQGEVYALIEDRDGGRVIRSHREFFKLEKKQHLKDRTNAILDKFFELLKGMEKFVLHLVGGLSEGKSSLFKAIYYLLLCNGFSLRKGDEREILSHSSSESVTTCVYSYHMTKTIGSDTVEIEIVDTTGIWKCPKEESSIEFEQEIPKDKECILSKILNGELKNGIDLDLDRRELLEREVPLNPISKADVVLCCFKYKNISSTKTGSKRFKALEEFVWKISNRPCVLVSTWYDELLRKDIVENSVNFEFDGFKFDQVNPQVDYIFNNFSEPIKIIEELGVDYLPIFNYDTKNLSFMKQFQSRKDLSEFLLAQLLFYSIEKKNACL